MNRQQAEEKKAAVITRLCKKAGCDAETSARHYEQLVKGGWNPHPPAAFVAWWKQHPESSDLSVVKAYNCQSYLDQYVEQLPF
jgi:hypothetical protein